MEQQRILESEVMWLLRSTKRLFRALSRLDKVVVTVVKKLATSTWAILK